MGRFQLQRGETVRLRLSPHPLSVLALYAIPLLLLFWGAFFFLLSGSGPVPAPTALKGLFASTEPLGLVGQWLLYALPMIVLTGVLWKSTKDRVLPVASVLALAAATFAGAAYPPFSSTIAVTTIASGLLGVAAAEASRRSTVYVVTSSRMVLRQGLLVTRERMTRLQNVSELESAQSLLGRLFDFGDIVPMVRPDDPADRPRTRKVKGKKEELPQWRIRGAHPFIPSKDAIFAVISDRVHQDYVEESATRTAKEERKNREGDTLSRLDELLQPAKRQNE
ncbi:MAG: PH domain-containing protein [Euryarchaeota archaeon]|nr:PH domain-containing protein [Euryarchaeota archaeon]